MATKKRVTNVAITEEKKKVTPLYTPTEEEKNVIHATFTKFRDSAADRNRNFEYFDGINLLDYLDDSVRRFTTNIDERDDIEDWQARIHDPFTRNKVLAILGKVVQVLPIASFTARGDEDCRKADILGSLYDYSEDVDDYEVLMTNILLEAIVKGTAIGFEGLNRKTKIFKNVKHVEDELTYSEDTETTSKLYGAVVPLEEFYPQSVGITNIKGMEYCFWRKVLTYQKFIADWGGYGRSAFVESKRVYGDKEQRPFYLDYVSNDVSDGSVELVQYYNKDTDSYIIMANGVWLNPLTIKGKSVISPLPWNHKELPFWDIKFDIFGSDFFYGKSLPDRLKTMQDVLNVLNNMLLDQSFLTIFPPMLTNGFDSIEDDYLRPGRRTPIDTQGLPINQAFMKLDLGTPSGWHQYILEYTRKIMEQSSLDQVSSGQAGVGGRTTAQEIRLAADGVASMLGLFGRSVNYGAKRKAMLRAGNIMQFWTDPDSPYINRVLGEGGNAEFNKAFNIFKVDNTVLTGGKRGTKVIELYGSDADKPTKAKLKARAGLHKHETGKNIEIVAVDPSYIREFEFDIKMVPDQRKSSTKDMDKAMQLQKVQIYLTYFPDMVNREELAAETAEKMGDDPSKILKDSVLHPTEAAVQPPGVNNGNGQGTVAGPQNDVSGAMGGQQNAMQMRDLQNSMTG